VGLPKALEADLAAQEDLLQSVPVVGLSRIRVINAVTLTTTIHRAPTPSGYGAISNHPSTTALQPLRLPELTVRLDDPGLGA
jgi:hypothetical protein